MIMCMQPEPVHPSAPLTRLVATLGPNSSSVEQLTALLQAGMQVRSVSGHAFMIMCQSFVEEDHASPRRFASNMAVPPADRPF
jgi:Pyruvate kinase, barrel domain